VNAPETISINFQPSASSTPSGYLADTGEEFGDRGNGYSYGWIGGSNDRTRERSTSAELRYRTLNHLSYYSTFNVWEIGLTNGDYSVTLGMGDPQYADAVNNVDIEGQVINDPDGADATDEYEANVTVNDGRLTIQPASGADMAKICFVEIASGSNKNGAFVKEKISVDKVPAIYPNPVQVGEMVYFATPLAERTSVYIVNNLGQAVYKRIMEANASSINIQKLAHGAYTIVLVNGSDIHQCTLLIE
jgi:hypothetical protein